MTFADQLDLLENFLNVFEVVRSFVMASESEAIATIYVAKNS